MKRNVLLLTAILIAMAGFADQNDWIKTTSEKSKVSFKLPEKPFVQHRDLNGISTEVYRYKDAVSVFGVVASDFSKKQINFSYTDPREYYEEMKSGSLVATDAILVSERSVAYQKMLGKEIVYTQLVGRHEYTYYKRFFFRGKFIYQFAIGGPSRMKQILLDKKNLFFNSIEFTD